MYIFLLVYRLFRGYGNCSGFVEVGGENSMVKGTKMHNVASNSLRDEDKLKKLRELKIKNERWNRREAFTICIRNAQICAHRASARWHAR